ncbi:sugar transferase [Agathobacter rectalis]|jgi:exopolysaccharide biosynthesis polyprenyl glycosylphosphotransferase|uniref:Sugar transferase n=1 Tax=Agathobacter rectalis TaxID=39491 RepID=A0A415K0N4_9FIRM|nr:sugar transferase [Agathobacter rectalis]RHL29859.1 sugar transferase [Agathobacter rectalis]
MYRKKNSEWLKHLDFEILDIICLEIAFMVAYFFRHVGLNFYMAKLYMRLCIVLVVIDIAVLFFTNNYKGIIQRNHWQELIAVAQHITIVEFLLLLFEYLAQETAILSRTVFLVSWWLAIALCFICRCTWKNFVRRRVMSEKNQASMLLITTENRLGELAAKLRQKNYREFRIGSVSILDDNAYGKDNIIEANIPIIYGKDSLLEYIRQNVVDEVFIDVYQDKKQLTELTDIFLQMGIVVHVGMGFLPENLPNAFMERIGEADAITASINTATGWQLSVKRITDIVGAIVGLAIMGVAFIFVAPIIKKQSPGPVFFKQKRVGKNGRTFYIYKFRSMYMDAEERKKELMAQNEMQGLMFKMDNDPRIIGSEKGPGKGIGNFIRKTSIDELPQFWNILKGDMSLIGTRPPTVNEYEQYDLHHKIRLSMKPGLTGMWQVSGRSDITDFEEVVRLDTEYIEHWSIGLDLKILFKTIKVVFEGEGSK